MLGCQGARARVVSFLLHLIDERTDGNDKRIDDAMDRNRHFVIARRALRPTPVQGVCSATGTAGLSSFFE